MVAPSLQMTAQQRSELSVMARSQSAPHRQVRQAKALLWAADGMANSEIARRSEASVSSVRRWRSRFEAEGVSSVGRVRPGRGRPPTVSAEKIERIVFDTQNTAPDDGAAAWSTRSMAARHGVSKDTVARIWRSHKMKPRRVD